MVGLKVEVLLTRDEADDDGGARNQRSRVRGVHATERLRVRLNTSAEKTGALRRQSRFLQTRPSSAISRSRDEENRSRPFTELVQFDPFI